MLVHVLAACGLLASASATHSAKILVPEQATLIAQSETAEVRVPPETLITAASRKATEKIHVLAGRGIDTLYDTTLAYADAVAFFDKQFQGGGLRVLAKTLTDTATAWTVKLGDGNGAHLIVRNTTPTTIEISEAASPVAPLALGD